MFNRALNDSEIIEIELFFNTKYGVLYNTSHVNDDKYGISAGCFVAQPTQTPTVNPTPSTAFPTMVEDSCVPHYDKIRAWYDPEDYDEVTKINFQQKKKTQ